MNGPRCWDCISECFVGHVRIADNTNRVVTVLLLHSVLIYTVVWPRYRLYSCQQIKFTIIWHCTSRSSPVYFERAAAHLIYSVRRSRNITAHRARCGSICSVEIMLRTYEVGGPTTYELLQSMNKPTELLLVMLRAWLGSDTHFVWTDNICL